MLILPLADPPADPALARVLAGAVGAVETAAPGHVLAHYLVGSHAAGAAVPGSDLDLLLVLRPGLPAAPRAGLRDLVRCLSAVSPVPLDAALLDPAEVADRWVGDLAAARRLWGADLRPNLPAGAAGRPGRAVRWAERVLADAVRLPADPADPWLGLARVPARYPGGADGPGLKGLAAAVLAPARALVLVRTGRWPADPGEPLAAAFAGCDRGGWADLVGFVSRRCRGEWGYRLPAGAADRRAVRAACERAAGFAAHFRAEVRAWTGREGDPGR